MEFTFTPQLGLLVGGIVGMIIGWVIGFFDSNNRTAKKIREAEEREEHAKKEAEKRIADAEEKFALNANVKQDDPGMLRIKNEGGRAVIEMDGAPLSGPIAPDKRKRLIDLVTILRPFLEGKPAPISGTIQPSTTPAPASPPPAARPAPTPPPPQPPMNEDELISRIVSSEPVKPVEAGIGSLFTPAKKDEEVVKPLSIVGQIDSILQKRLAGSPLAGHGIKLQESRDGAVEVYIGTQKFPGIDEVPDETVKAAIRAAVSEWENTAGR